jgi:hypothetical protein
MKNPSPGSCLGGCGRPGDGTVEIGAALTTRMRRTPETCIARTIARVPCSATPALAIGLGPTPDNTASAPATAASRTPGSGAARSAVTTRAPFRLGTSFRGSRTTTVTS